MRALSRVRPDRFLRKICVAITDRSLRQHFTKFRQIIGFTAELFYPLLLTFIT
jgi:hypothetical protein